MTTSNHPRIVVLHQQDVWSWETQTRTPNIILAVRGKHTEMHLTYPEASQVVRDLIEALFEIDEAREWL